MSLKGTPKNILVIGSLSDDDIQILSRGPSAGEAIIVKKRHRELGGRGCNVALSAFRSSHVTPPNGVVNPHQRHVQKDGSDLFDVHIIGAVADDDFHSRFTTYLSNNGVDTQGIKLLERLEGEEGEEDMSGEPVQQDFCVSLMEEKTGDVKQTLGFSASNQWSKSHFPDIETICSGYRPDLVIVTMELKKELVEHIIDMVHDADIEILLYATPGENITLAHYPKITHLVCSQRDAVRMLGYKPEEIDPDTWSEVCSGFLNRGVKNVVLKTGPAGAYYKNENADGYSSAYKKIFEVVDQSGATGTFVGTYVVEYLRSRNGNPTSTPTDWDISLAVDRGNRACDFVVSEVGYATTVPWMDAIHAHDAQPAYASLEEFKHEPQKKRKGRSFGWKAGGSGSSHELK